jgi:branched-chain amino acid transport system permease protein
MTLLSQSLAIGLVFGAIYSLLAIGVTLQAGVMKIINVSYCHVMMLAMYLTLELYDRGISPYLALPFVAAVAFGIGAFIYYAFLHRARTQESLNLVIITLGLTWVIESIALIRYSADLRTVRVEFLSKSIHIGSIALSVGQLLALFVSLTGVALIMLLLQHTYLGRAIRAASQEEYAAQLVGVRPTRVRIFAFGLASAAAGVAGVVLAPIFVIRPGVGWDFLLFAFVAVVIGGLGSTSGALLGGMTVGIIQAVSGAYLSSTWSTMLLFGTMVVVLLVRPQGLLGEKLL